MEGRGVKQDLMPNVGQLEFANVPIKGWIIDPDIHGLLDGPNGIVHLPAHCGEIVHTDGGRGPEIFFQPFPKGLCRLPYLFLLAIHLVTLRPVDSHLFEWYYPCPWGPPGGWWWYYLLWNGPGSPTCHKHS